MLARPQLVCLGAAAVSIGVAAWATLRRRRDLQLQQFEHDHRQHAAELQWKVETAHLNTEITRLTNECERLNSALSVALRREEQREMEAQRHLLFLAEERETLEASHEALSMRATAHEAKLTAYQAALDERKAACESLRVHNAEKAERLETLKSELEAMRRANAIANAANVAAMAPAEAAAAPWRSPPMGQGAPTPPPPEATQERRAKNAQDSARRRARMNERRELAAKMESQIGSGSAGAELG